MSEEWLITLLWATWLSLATTPLGFMLGAECSPCCDKCGGGLPYSDPKDEGTWVPGGELPVLSWSFVASPGDESGETWFFRGSATSSKQGGNASLEEQEDWNNLCNWYSRKGSAPSNLLIAFERRANRLPPQNAVVHIYTPISTASSGPRVVKTAYFWGRNARLVAGSEITATYPHPAHGFGCLFLASNSISILAPVNEGAVNADTFFYGFSGPQVIANSGTVNGLAEFRSISNGPQGVINGNAKWIGGHNGGLVNGDALFINASNEGVVDGNATFESSDNAGTAFFNPLVRVTGSAVFRQFSRNNAEVLLNAVFYDSYNGVVKGWGRNPTVGGTAEFYGTSFHLFPAVILGDAFFYDNSQCQHSVAGNSQFFNASLLNGGYVNGNATFYNQSVSLSGSVVAGVSEYRDNSSHGFGVSLAPTASGGAVFLHSSRLAGGVVEGGARFSDSSTFIYGIVNGGAVFKGQSTLLNTAPGATVNGGATFEDAACSRRWRGSPFLCPSGEGRARFVAHPTDEPTCNGSAPNACNVPNVTVFCGCG